MALPGNLIAENYYFPYVRDNGGFNTNLPIKTSSDLTVNGTINGVVAGLTTTSVTVSPIGLSTPGVSIINNGLQFGPDTPNTTTCGIQEALNSLPTCSEVGQGATQSAQSGKLVLATGIFSITLLITIPRGSIIIQGSGWSSWHPIDAITAYEDVGGTAIVSNAYTVGLMTIPVGGNGNPATTFSLRDLDLRMTSPTVAQTTSTPAILKMSGWRSGDMTNVNVLEVNTGSSGTGIGYNLYRVIDCQPFASKDTTLMTNVRAFGGNFSLVINSAHHQTMGVTAGGCYSSIVGSNLDCAINLTENLGCQWNGLHAFSAGYGLQVNSYGNVTNVPTIIYGMMFESVAHYLLASTNTEGTLVLYNPCWNEPSLNPITDIASTITSPTYNVLTKYEQNTATGVSGNVLHIAPAAFSQTSGASPYTLPAQQYDQIVVITTVGGLSALVLDGQALFNSSFSIGQQVYVGAGHSLVATWTTTAPVFQVLPQ